MLLQFSVKKSGGLAPRNQNEMITSQTVLPSKFTSLLFAIQKGCKERFILISWLSFVLLSKR